MTIVVGYAVAVVVTVLAVWLVAGRRYVIERDPDVNLAEIGGRHTSIMSGLAGFAVTGMVLLVTLGRSLPDTSSTSYTTVVTMFFIAWMAFSGTAFLFANITDAKSGTAAPAFDVPAAHFAGAAITLEFAFGLGWLALRPLFEAFGLQRLVEIAGPISVAIAIASYGLVAHHLRRAGYGPDRVLAAIPILAIASTLVYGLTVGMLGLRSPEATLDLVVTAFGVGVIAFLGLTTLIITGRHPVGSRLLARYGRYLVLGYGQAVMVLVGFLVLSILGLA